MLWFDAAGEQQLLVVMDSNIYEVQTTMRTNGVGSWFIGDRVEEGM